MLLYGMSIGSLAKFLDTDEEEAQEAYDKVMASMPNTMKYIDGVHDFVERYGYVDTMQGNWRRLPEAQHGSFGQKARALRQSYNAIVQGTGPYITNTALIMVRQKLRQKHLKAKLVITVHDSIVIDIPSDEVDIVVPMVKHTMEHLPIRNFVMDSKGYNVPDKFKIDDNHFQFPLFSEIAFGRTYGDDIDFDFETRNKFSDMETYYQYGKESTYLSDLYGSKIKKAGKDEDKVADLKAEQKQKQREIDLKYHI